MSTSVVKVMQTDITGLLSPNTIEFHMTRVSRQSQQPYTGRRK